MDTTTIDESIDESRWHHKLLVSALAVIIFAATLIGAGSLLIDDPAPSTVGSAGDHQVLVSVRIDADVLHGGRALHDTDPDGLCQVGPGPVGHIARVDDDFGATTSTCTQQLPSDGPNRQS